MHEILADVCLHTVETVIKAITVSTLVGNNLIFIQQTTLGSLQCSACCDRHFGGLNMKKTLSFPFINMTFSPKEGFDV